MIKISNFITYLIAGKRKTHTHTHTHKEITQAVSLRSKDERLSNKNPRSLIPKNENYIKI